jgi:glutaredoxin-related protein
MADVQERIKQLVTDNRVMLFMKGDRDFPQCGFSMRAVNIVNALGVNYETLNVLADNEVRQGIKEFCTSTASSRVAQTSSGSCTKMATSRRRSQSIRRSRSSERTGKRLRLQLPL